MKNSTLKDQWELYKCAGELAHFGILMDFIKQSANQFYDSKAKKEKIEEEAKFLINEMISFFDSSLKQIDEEIEIFKKKYYYVK